MNNKGFAVTVMVYGMIALASLIMFLSLRVMSTTKKETNTDAQEVEDNLNLCTAYDICDNWINR